jgi:hypothetical protein
MDLKSNALDHLAMYAFRKLHCAQFLVQMIKYKTGNLRISLHAKVCPMELLASASCSVSVAAARNAMMILPVLTVSTIPYQVYGQTEVRTTEPLAVIEGNKILTRPKP